MSWQQRSCERLGRGQQEDKPTARHQRTRTEGEEVTEQLLESGDGSARHMPFHELRWQLARDEPFIHYLGRALADAVGRIRDDGVEEPPASGGLEDAWTAGLRRLAVATAAASATTSQKGEASARVTVQPINGRWQAVLGKGFRDALHLGLLQLGGTGACPELSSNGGKMQVAPEHTCTECPGRNQSARRPAVWIVNQVVATHARQIGHEQRELRV